MRDIFLGLIAVMLLTQPAPGEVSGMVTDYQRDALDLNGTWQVQLERVDKPSRQPPELLADSWTEVQVPGPLFKENAEESNNNLRCAWARRTFRLTAEQAQRGAVLKWGGMRFGATIYVNGERVGQRVPVGPYTLLLRPGILRQGENVLLLCVGGWGGIPRGEAGFPLFPTGSATQGWGGKNPCIPEGIWLEFYDRVYVERALALPDIRGRRAVFRVDLTSSRPLPRDVLVEAIVRDAESGETVGQVSQVVSALTVPAFISVPMSSVKPWTPQTPNLYEAQLIASADGQPCDRVTFRFGMRSIEVVDGHYRLNGQPLWLRGSNLVYEWLWGDVFKGKEKAYLVDEARRMNLNCFRTHTMPPPADWTNVCDQYGTMILAELPVLYNHMDFKFTDSELATFNAHALDDAEQWISKLWNHPAVILWVLTNESPGFNEAFESGEFWQFVKRLDPTRPVMRAGPAGRAGTPEVYDMHTCHNFAAGAEGELLRIARTEAGRKDQRRTLSNSEYMNVFGKHTERWLGAPQHENAALVFAEFALEHTEAMRRASFDCILPYMFAGWTGLRDQPRWRDDYPTPMAAALHSSMAPVLASLDLFNRNYFADQELTVPVVLINELSTDVPATIDYYLTARDPLFVPDESALQAAVWHQSRQRNFRANTVERDEITVPVPQAEGAYFLAAVVRRPGDQPVISQRVVRAVAPVAPVAIEPLKRQRVVLLGGDPVARWTMRALNLEPLTAWPHDAPPDVALVWDARRITPQDKENTAAILDWIQRGGRQVMLDQDRWDWPELIDIRLSEKGDYLRGMSSRAFLYGDVGTRAIFSGLRPEHFMRFNGLLGRIADRYFRDPLPAGAVKLMWMENPNEPILVSVPIGEGEILLCQLQLKERIAPDSEHYDPVAQHLFVNLLTTTGAAPTNTQASTPRQPATK